MAEDLAAEMVEMVVDSAVETAVDSAAEMGEMTMSRRLSTRLLPLLSTSCLRVKREYTNLVEDAEI